MPDVMIYMFDLVTGEYKSARPAQFRPQWAAHHRRVRRDACCATGCAGWPCGLLDGNMLGNARGPSAKNG